MKKRILCAFLVAAQILTFAACGGGGTAENTDVPAVSDTTETVGDTTAEPDEEQYRVADNLPEMDLGGETITFLVNSTAADEFVAEGGANVVDDATYNRNQKIMERFGVELNYIQKAGSWAEVNEYWAAITSSVQIADDAYQVVTGQSNIILPLSIQGMYTNLAQPTYIDYTKPWWKDGFHDNITIADRMYVLCGDYTISTIKETVAVFFNHSVFDNRNLTYPYQAVKDGTWTYDMLSQLILNTYDDVNGDGAIQYTDFFGLSLGERQLCALPFSCLSAMVTRGDDGSFVCEFPTERDLAVYDMLLNLVASKDVYYSSGSGNPGELISGTRMFIMMPIYDMPGLASMEDEFGVLPYPKYDEEQETYACSIIRRFTAAAVPTTVKHKDSVELILESMACEGYNKVVPAYFESALKARYSRNPETSQMLDIIMESQYFDFMEAFFTEMGGMSDSMMVLIDDNSNLTTYWKRYKKSVSRKMSNLIEDYEELDD